MKNITFVYDDRFIVSDALKNIVGIRKYGDIIYKKKTLHMHISDILNHAPHNIKINMIVLKDLEIDVLPESDLYLYMKANYVIYNQDIFINILNKLSYIEDSYKILDDIYIFNNINSLYKIVNNIEFYIDNFKESILLFSNIENVFINIEELNNFLFFLSSGLDTRFFNQLAGNDYTITKSSSKISKIHNEYTYYQLIPDYMKVWFVMPYDYHETKDFASYKMERINATDLALKYVHNSITKHELTNILNKIFYFIKNRKTKSVSQDIYNDYKHDLYNKKVEERIMLLKQTSFYPQLSNYTINLYKGYRYKNIDDIFNHYITLYNRLSKLDNFNTLVIGHGDLCFSNILYNSQTYYMKFIDTKGATTEDELFANPYYDIAKLSHSICGLYDFFNADLFSLQINNNLSIDLNISYNNTDFIEIFKHILEENNFNYVITRLYEASLFLSMLPFHIDYPKKVLGFLINAINILHEVERCLKN